MAPQDAYAINARGDMSLLTHTAVGSGPIAYYLDRYNATTGAIERLADITAPVSLGAAQRQTTVAMADSGALVARIGGSGYGDAATSLLLWKIDGTQIDLGQLLPEYDSIPSFPYPEQFSVSPGGKVLFDARNDITGLITYFEYDIERDHLRRIATLADLTFPLDHAVPTEDNRVYFWTTDGDDHVLAYTTVPEPGTGVLLVLASLICAVAKGANCYGWLRPKRPA
jgi:hypothetical protein